MHVTPLCRSSRRATPTSGQINKLSIATNTTKCIILQQTFTNFSPNNNSLITYTAQTRANVTTTTVNVTPICTNIIKRNADYRIHMSTDTVNAKPQSTSLEEHSNDNQSIASTPHLQLISTTNIVNKKPRKAAVKIKKSKNVDPHDEFIKQLHVHDLLIPSILPHLSNSDDDLLIIRSQSPNGSLGDSPSHQ